MKKQAGLDTLRKVHDSIGYERLSKDSTQKKRIQPITNLNPRGSVKHSMEYRNKLQNRTNLIEIQKSSLN